MNLAFFSCLFMIRKSENYFENIEDLTGLSKNHPILSISLLIVLFSLAGIPPLAGFFSKFYIFMAVIEQSMYFLAVIGLLSTVIAAYYYLRIIKIIYFDPEKEKYDTDHHLGLKVSLAISTIFILFYFDLDFGHFLYTLNNIPYLFHLHLQLHHNNYKYVIL